MKHPQYYQHIDRLSLRYAYYAFLDTDVYLADQLFIKHQVRVRFREEYVRNDSPYRVIFCQVRKRDRMRFLAAMEELPNKMLLLGHTDYLETCYALWNNQHQDEEKEVIGYDSVDSIRQTQ